MIIYEIEKISYCSVPIMMPLGMLLFGIYLSFMTLMFHRGGIKVWNFVPVPIMIVFISSILLLNSFLMIRYNNNFENNYKQNKCKIYTVEGITKNFKPYHKNPKSEKIKNDYPFNFFESFTISNIYFEYNTSFNHLGYREVYLEGGKLKPNTYYKITYYPNEENDKIVNSIIKIEVK